MKPVIFPEQLALTATPDLQTAIFLAAVCGQTYLQYTNKSDGLFLVPKTYELIGTLKARALDHKLEPFGFIMSSPQATIVAFRGTSSAVDWISDFIAQQTTFSPVKQAGQTHKGFTDIYLSMREQLLDILLQTPLDRPLFITGHSLGGALATLAALDLSHNSQYQQPIVYTFGAPRVGDPTFARYYNKYIATHWRYQNEFDIVPHLPPLVYQSPNTKKTYLYIHVKEEVARSFRYGTVSGNHILESYFNDLAKENPDDARSICSQPPGWCPVFTEDDDSSF
ncbi:Mbeg1-like protein [Paenibacillus yanchengensis]|uniref:Mbeg1-like protein n=1 Tax=Paenibacillus yanchengensis TaxID=2035833 RepID=A0ABW4YGV1_9BACL